MGKTWPYEMGAARYVIKSPTLPGRDAGISSASGGIVTLEGKGEPKAAFPACEFHDTSRC